jgi:hypothetical protein
MSEGINAEFMGTAKIQKAALNLAKIRLTPEDLSNPVSFQLALSRIYEHLMESMEKGLKTVYVAEVRFTDSLGNNVVFAVNLGESVPPFSSDRVKARIFVEFYEE